MQLSTDYDDIDCPKDLPNPLSVTDTVGGLADPLVLVIDKSCQLDHFDPKIILKIPLTGVV